MSEEKKEVINTETPSESATPPSEAVKNENKSPSPAPKRKRTPAKRASDKKAEKKDAKEEFVIPDTQPSKEDLEIVNDLYDLYLKNYSDKQKGDVSLNVFDAIEEEIAEEVEITPNTATETEASDEQITFSEEFDDGEDVSLEYEEEKELPPYNSKKPRRIDNRFDFVELFIFTLLIVMVLTSFIFRHSIVEGGSMQNTLQDGEHLIISDAFYTPCRGDIVVCEDYTTGLRKPIVKRIIAIAGDTVDISVDGVISVNGEILQEEYVFIDGKAYYEPLNIVVPDGEIFVMGDHRNASTDSREFGCVDADSILGKVLLRFYPFDKFGTVN